MSIRSPRSKSGRDGTGLACIAACLLALGLAAPAARADCGNLLGPPRGPSPAQARLSVRAGSSCYDPRVDYDSDGVVGDEDLVYFRQNLGRDLTPPVVAIASPVREPGTERRGA